MQAILSCNLQPAYYGSGLPNKTRSSTLRPPRVGSDGGLGVRSMRNGSMDSLDNLQRAPKVRQQQAEEQQQEVSRRKASQATPLGLWDRFPAARTIEQMMDTMDRIMDDPFAYNRVTVPMAMVSNGDVAGGYRRGRTPWEIKDCKEEYKMRFDMPGMTKNDVKVSVEEKTLVVKAEKVDEQKKEEEDEEEEGWSAKSYGRYNTRIELPENVEVEKIKAEVKDGVLYITIPKVSASSKVLDINVQ